MFDVVAAVLEQSYGIGANGGLPWPPHAKDRAHVKSLTTGGVLIMGRKTFESIPNGLSEREIIVVTSRTNPSIANTCPNLQAALDMAANVFPSKSVFVFGGARLYAEAMLHHECRRMYITWMCHHHQTLSPDTFFPRFDHWTETMSYEIDSEQPARFCVYERAESQYLRLVRQALRVPDSSRRVDRTQIGTYSVFGARMQFSLRDNCMPLLTTKRVFWRGIVEELLWMIRGSTDACELQQQKVHIWDAHASRDYLESIGLGHYGPGDLGPVYGFQWRHFGASYVDCHTDYTDQGFDQLAMVIHLIKTQPTSRRIVLCAWNPPDLAKSALPPCHVLCQFYVTNGELSCQLYQRSGDLGLGVPFNIASYALLTHMIAYVCGLKPGDFIHVLGDAHVYSNHVDPLQQQLQRNPREFPRLLIRKGQASNGFGLYDFGFNDFELIGYEPHSLIAMDVAV